MPPLSQTKTASSGYANYVLVLLALVYVMSFIDRQILAMLMEPIKAEFGASDTAMGMLTGFAFVLFYTLAGIPIVVITASALPAQIEAMRPHFRRVLLKPIRAQELLAELSGVLPCQVEAAAARAPA